MKNLKTILAIIFFVLIDTKKTPSIDVSLTINGPIIFTISEGRKAKRKPSFCKKDIL